MQEVDAGYAEDVLDAVADLRVGQAAQRLEPGQGLAIGGVELRDDVIVGAGYAAVEHVAGGYQAPVQLVEGRYRVQQEALEMVVEAQGHVPVAHELEVAHQVVGPGVVERRLVAEVGLEHRVGHRARDVARINCVGAAAQLAQLHVLRNKQVELVVAEVATQELVEAQRVAQRGDGQALEAE